MDVSTSAKAIEWIDHHRRYILMGLTLFFSLIIALSWISFFRSFLAWKEWEEQLVSLQQRELAIKRNIEMLEKRANMLDQEIEQVKNEAKRKEEEFMQKALQGALDGVTESDVSYWRKQLLTYAVLRGVLLQITGRSTSPYDKAVQLSISVEPVDKNKPLDAFQIAQALDFLQLYGYVESFDGKTAILHIRLN